MLRSSAALATFAVGAVSLFTVGCQNATALGGPGVTTGTPVAAPSASSACDVNTKLAEARQMLAVGRNGLAIRAAEEATDCSAQAFEAEKEQLAKALLVLSAAYEAAGDKQRAREAADRFIALKPPIVGPGVIPPDSLPADIIGEPSR